MTGGGYSLSQYIPVLAAFVKCLAAILAGILLGNGAVYFFNKMPAGWFTEYGERPSDELLDPYTQRIKSYPWKFVLTMFFVAAGICFVMRDYRSAVPMVIVLWLLVEMAIGDAKYRIIPDELVVLTAITAIGFVNYNGGWKDCLIGAGAGFALMGLIALTGRLLYGKSGAGGGDLKLFTALGLVLGLYGIITVFVLMACISAAHYIILIIRKKLEKDGTMPLVPYITAAVTIYFIFLWGKVELLLTL